jgi:hypothetical protein
LPSEETISNASGASFWKSVYSLRACDMTSLPVL